jgi:hypothetical protein
MRLCQVAQESDLPEYYRMLANTKRGERRHCLEALLEQAAELLGYDLVFPVSPALAQKVNECHWYQQFHYWSQHLCLRPNGPGCN